MADEKLTDIEREQVRKISAKWTKRCCWVGVAALACLGGAIWFGDWRLVGIAVLLFFVAVVVFTVMAVATSPGQEAGLAKTLHTAQRAKKAKEEQDRQRVEDLERDLFGAEG